MSVYMYLKINALGDYKKKYDPFARLLALKRGVGVCSVVGVVSGFYGNYNVLPRSELKTGRAVFCLQWFPILVLLYSKTFSS